MRRRLPPRPDSTVDCAGGALNDSNRRPLWRCGESSLSAGGALGSAALCRSMANTCSMERTCRSRSESDSGGMVAIGAVMGQRRRFLSWPPSPLVPLPMSSSPPLPTQLLPLSLPRPVQLWLKVPPRRGANAPEALAAIFAVAAATTTFRSRRRDLDPSDHLDILAAATVALRRGLGCWPDHGNSGQMRMMINWG